MKTVLEKFDHSPLWIRLGVLSILFGILITGMVFVQGQSDSTRNSVSSAASIASSSSSLQLSSAQKEAQEKEIQEEEQAVQAAEEAVKQLETMQTLEDLQLAKTAVEKVKDAATKARFQSRIQAIAVLIDPEAAQSAVSENPVAASEEAVAQPQQ